MALTQIAFGNVSKPGAENPIPTAMHVESLTVCENLTPSSTAQATTIAAPSVTGNWGARIATDTMVYVSFGTAPVAGTDSVRFLVPANQIAFFLVPAGYKASVITG